MQTYFEGEQASLFAPDTFAGRMSQAASAQARRTGRISGLSWRKLLDYIAPDYQFLDLSSDAGNLLGQYEWTTRSALHGGCWLRNTGASPRDAIESFLSQILQAHPPKKYYLTTAACLGILRRAEERGKPLPKALDTALRIQAGLIGLPEGRKKTDREKAQNLYGAAERPVNPERRGRMPVRTGRYAPLTAGEGEYIECGNLWEDLSFCGSHDGKTFPKKPAEEPRRERPPHAAP